MRSSSCPAWAGATSPVSGGGRRERRRARRRGVWGWLGAARARVRLRAHRQRLVGRRAADRRSRRRPAEGLVIPVARIREVLEPRRFQIYVDQLLDALPASGVVLSAEEVAQVSRVIARPGFCSECGAADAETGPEHGQGCFVGAALALLDGADEEKDGLVAEGILESW